MKYTKEEMRKAAQTLMKGCRERVDLHCEDCPFRADGYPYIEDLECPLYGDSPIDWCIED